MTADPLDEVYEKFKHLDKCLSDDLQGEFIHRIAHELWVAIKESRARRDAPAGGGRDEHAEA